MLFCTVTLVAAGEVENTELAAVDGTWHGSVQDPNDVGVIVVGKGYAKTFTGRRDKIRATTSNKSITFFVGLIFLKLFTIGFSMSVTLSSSKFFQVLYYKSMAMI